MLTTISNQLFYTEYPIKMVWGLVRFNAKSIIFKTDDGKIGIISPGRINDAMANTIATHSEVAYLIAPNCYHHIFLAAAAKRYPNAAVYVPPYLAEKVDTVPARHTVIASGESYPWSSAMSHELIAGMPKMNEFIFFHKATQTMIVTDLIFNFKSYENVMTRIAFRMMGAHRPVSCCKLFSSYIKDNAAFASSIKTIAAWNYKRVIVAHGDTIEAPQTTAVNHTLQSLISSYV